MRIASFSRVARVAVVSVFIVVSVFLALNSRHFCNQQKVSQKENFTPKLNNKKIEKQRDNDKVDASTIPGPRVRLLNEAVVKRLQRFDKENSEPPMDLKFITDRLKDYNGNKVVIVREGEAGWRSDLVEGSNEGKKSKSIDGQKNEKGKNEEDVEEEGEDTEEVEINLFGQEQSVVDRR
jgi:hypothetical protein